MKKSKLFSFAVFSFSFALILAGCTLLQNIANNAPHATQPTLISFNGTHTFPNDDNYYTKYSSFAIIIRKNLVNTVVILEDGNAIQTVAPNSSAATNKTTYWEDGANLPQDPNALWAQRAYRILLKTNESHGAKHTYSFVETSINPNYKSEPPSSPLLVKMVLIKDKMSITSFAVPNSSPVNSGFMISWRVLNCKYVKLLDPNRAEITNAETFKFMIGTGGHVQVRYPLLGTVPYFLECTDYLEDVIKTNQSIYIYSDLQQNCANGNGSSFTFCITCPDAISGAYKYSQTLNSCSESDARQAVQGWYGNCSLALISDPNDCH